MKEGKTKKDTGQWCCQGCESQVVKELEDSGDGQCELGTEIYGG